LQKIYDVNIESDNVINLQNLSLEKAEYSTNNFEPHESPSSSITSLAANAPTIPAEDTKNIQTSESPSMDTPPSTPENIMNPSIDDLKDLKGCSRNNLHGVSQQGASSNQQQQQQTQPGTTKKKSHY
jgi:hypothetical protein